MITHEQYKLEKTNLLKKIDRMGNEQIGRDFIYQMVSASFRNFLPQRDEMQHRSLFKDLLINQHLAEAEQHLDDLASFVDIEVSTGMDLDLLKSGAGIICTFHTGSYRLIGHLLKHLGVPFSLVVSSDVSAREKELVTGRYGEKDSFGQGFEVIEADRPKGLFRMLGSLKRGRSLLVFVDGNQGVGNAAENPNVMTVPFLDQYILARAGVGHISYLTGCPVFPVICRRKNDRAELCFFPPVSNAGERLSRDKYALRVMRLLYGYLADLVKVDPPQWEGWLSLYAHAFIREEKEDATGSLRPFDKSCRVRFNRKDYGLMEKEGTAILIRKPGYKTFEIDMEVYRLLAGILKNPGMSVNLWKIPDVPELFKMRILLLDQ